MRQDSADETPEEQALQRKLDMTQLFIETYELNRADALITSILERCREIGGSFKIKAIQALAFIRWKQGRQAEALVLFLEQEDMLDGPSSALFQNIGHAYSYLEQLDKAEEYFLNLIDESVSALFPVVWEKLHKMAIAMQ